MTLSWLSPARMRFLMLLICAFDAHMDRVKLIQGANFPAILPRTFCVVAEPRCAHLTIKRGIDELKIRDRFCLL